MNEPAPISTDVFVIPLLERSLVYAPLRRAAFIANAAAASMLHRLRQGPVQPANESEAAFLRLCDETRLTGDEGDQPITTFESAVFQPTDVTLFLTTRCNLRCVYCYASAGERPLADMALTTAKRGIAFVCQNAVQAGKHSFTVGYHGGGEPTVHWSVLTESFAYAQQCAAANGLDVDGSMATNGVLRDEQRQWIIHNFQGVSLSMDGLPAVQDRQRPTASGAPSSDAVLETMRAFDEAGFPYGVRITVTGAALESLPRSLAYLLERAHPQHIQVEPVYLLGRGRDQGMAVDPHAFVQAFFEAKRLADDAGADMFYSAARMDVLTNRFCQSCGEGFSLTPQGIVSSCYEVPDTGFEYAHEFIFGRFDEEQQRYVFDEHKLAALRRHTVENIAWCRDCFCKWHCAGDCAYKTRHAWVNGEFAGDERCEITRALTLAQILQKINQSGGSVWAEGGVTGSMLTQRAA